MVTSGCSAAAGIGKPYQHDAGRLFECLNSVITLFEKNTQLQRSENWGVRNKLNALACST